MKKQNKTKQSRARRGEWKGRKGRKGKRMEGNVCGGGAGA